MNGSLRMKVRTNKWTTEIPQALLIGFHSGSMFLFVWRWSGKSSHCQEYSPCSSAFRVLKYLFKIAMSNVSNTIPCFNNLKTKAMFKENFGCVGCFGETSNRHFPIVWLAAFLPPCVMFLTTQSWKMCLCCWSQIEQTLCSSRSLKTF